MNFVDGGTGHLSPNSNTDNPKRVKLENVKSIMEEREETQLSHLQEENERLMTEQEFLVDRIQSLQEAVKNELGEGFLAEWRENEELRGELTAHRNFVNSFMSMIHATPMETNTKRRIYEEGAELAHTMLLHLLSSSQTKGWRKCKLDSSARKNLGKTEVFFNLDPNPRKGSGERAAQLQLRFDTYHSGMTVDGLAEVVKGMLTDETFKSKFVQRDRDKYEIEMRPLAHEVVDEDLMVLYHRKRCKPPEKDRDVVFVFNSKKTEMARSTLATPTKPVGRNGTAVVVPQVSRPSKRGRPLGSKSERSKLRAFGQTNVVVLSRMSTTLLAGASKSEDAQRINSPVLHGCFLLEEEGIGDEESEPQIRSIFLTSTPQEFTEEFLTWDTMIREDGSLTVAFSAYLDQVIASVTKHLHMQSTSKSTCSSSSSTSYFPS